MMKIIILIFMVLFTTISNSYSFEPNPDFNYTAYNKIDLDYLIEYTPKSAFGKTQYDRYNTPLVHLEESTVDGKTGEGIPDISMDILHEPKKYLIEGTLTLMPLKIRNDKGTKLNRYEYILKGISKQEVAVNYAIEIQSRKGKKILTLVQDALVDDMYNELQKGVKVSLYVLHYFNDNEGPGLLVSEFISN